MKPGLLLGMVNAIAGGMSADWDTHKRQMQILSELREKEEQDQFESDKVEYEKIQRKESTLSANARYAVVYRVESRLRRMEAKK